MPIDPNIAMGFRPTAIESPVNALSGILKLQHAQGANQLNQLQLKKYTREAEQENLLAEAYRGSLGADGKIDRQKLYQDAASRGLGAKIPSLQKGFMETDKAEGEAEKLKIETHLKKLSLGAQILSTAQDQPSYDAARATAQASGLDVSNMPPQFDPKFVAGKLQESQTLEQQLAQKWKAMEYTTPNANSRLTAETSRLNNAASVSASLANAQARRDAAQTTGNATRDAARIQTGFKNEQDLRKEFEALPEVKKYKQALPSFKGIEDAVKRNTAQSDINIVYGIAKLYDPDSVVREGEYATVANSPNIPDRIKGYAQYLAGGGRLTDKVKGEILDEAKSRMKSYEDQHGSARKNYESIAGRSGVDVTRVFPSPVTPAVAGGAGGSKPSVSNW